MDQYKKEKVIGEGAYGQIFLVSDLKDGLFYTMKVLKIPKYGARQVYLYFRKEVDILRILSESCSQLFPCLRAYSLTDEIFYISDYVPGFNLIELDRKYITVQFCIEYLSQMDHILSVLRQHNIGHCDIKPHNILFNPITEQFTLIDFGMAVQNTPSNILRGTYTFMSPLVKDGLIRTMNDHFISDEYSVGVTLFYILNRKYYDGNWIWNEDKTIIDKVNDKIYMTHG